MARHHLPTIFELEGRDKKNLSPVKLKGGYADVETYAKTYYQLTREDFMSQVRRGIRQYKRDYRKPADRRQRNFELEVCEEIKFGHQVPEHTGVSWQVFFDPYKFKFGRKQLIPNALVLFAFGERIEAVGLVACGGEFCEIELENEGLVHIAIHDGFLDVDNKKYTMLVATDYFAPYKCVLPRLTNDSVRSMPFQEGIIEMDKSYKQNPPLPYYVEHHNRKYDLSCLLREEKDQKKWKDSKTTVDITKKDWPYQSKMMVNSKQLQAVKLALTNELALIQGPPGTGKTFIALEIIKIMLNNQEGWRKNINPNVQHQDGPIVIVCFTNHALDEMLRKLLDDKICVKDEMVRLGRRCNEEKLEGILIHELRQEFFDKGLKYSKEVEQMAKEVSQEIFPDKGMLKTMITKQDNLRHGFPSFEQLFGHNLPMKKMMKRVIDQNIQLNGGWTKVSKETYLEQWVNPNGANFKRVPLPRHFSYAPDDQSLETVNPDDEHENEVEHMPFFRLKTKHWIPKNDRIRKLLNQVREDDTYFKSFENKSFDELVQLFARNMDLRLKYFGYMRKIAIASLQSDIHSVGRRFNDHCQGSRRVRNLKDVEICRDRKIIGMTSTAAARCSDLLKELGSKIMICEEASEVLESHTISSLTSACQHLIMIGDHQQLRPKPANDNFANQKHLDIPLFERLIMNGFKSIRLDDQRRMRPEISLYPKTVFYKGMTDHMNVTLQRRPVCIKNNVYFLNYNAKKRQKKILEEQPLNSNSKTNTVEANFAVQLAWFFIRCGYKSSQITLLSYYGAQIKVLRECRDALKSPKDSFFKTDFDIKTVDNFQGQENEIIIVSTVRANDRNEVGFTANKNRTNVALSRAKQCMIVLGDFDMLKRAKRSNNCWKDIYQVAQKANNFTDGSLPIECPNHASYKKTIDITNPHQLFDHFPKGGCNKMCKGTLKCGHKCTWKCHDQKFHDVEDIIKCEQPCKRKCKRDKHRSCKLPCWQPCASCPVLIPREESDIDPKVLRRCDHKDPVPCGSGFFWRCPVLVKRKLACGHENEFKCGASKYELICKRPGCLWYNKVHFSIAKLDTIRPAENLITANFMASKILEHIDTYQVPVIGFDMEWVGNNRTALIQISCFTNVGIENFLFRSSKFMIERCEPLLKILKSREIIKLGVCVKGDLDRVAEEVDFDIAKGAYLELDYLFEAYTEVVKKKVIKQKTRLQTFAEHVLGRLMDYKRDEEYTTACSNWDAKSLNSRQLKYAADDSLVAIQMFAKFCIELGQDKVDEVVAKYASTDYVLKPKPKPKKEYEEDDMLQSQMENLHISEETKYNDDWFKTITEFDPPVLDEVYYADTSESATEYANEILRYAKEYKVPFVGMDAEWFHENPICLIQISVYDAENESGFCNYLFRSSKFNIYQCAPLMELLTSDEIMKIGVEVEGDLQRLAYEKPPESLQVADGAFLDLYHLTLAQGDRTPGLKRIVRDYCGRELDKTCQESNWEDELTEEMKQYAADDSLCAMQVLASLFQKEGFDSIMAQATKYKNQRFGATRQRQKEIDQKLEKAMRLK